MNLSDEVDLEDYVSRPDKISAAEVSLMLLWFLDFIYSYFLIFGGGMHRLSAGFHRILG